MDLSYENYPKSEELSIQYPGADNLLISVFSRCSIACVTLLFIHREMALALVLDCVLVMTDIKDLCVMSVQMAIINKLLEISNSVTVSQNNFL